MLLFHDEITSCGKQESVSGGVNSCGEAHRMNRFLTIQFGKVVHLGGENSLVEAQGWESGAYVQGTESIQFCLETTYKTLASPDILWCYKLRK